MGDKFFPSLGILGILHKFLPYIMINVTHLKADYLYSQFFVIVQSLYFSSLSNLHHVLFFLPFVVIVCLGIAGVCIAYRLWRMFLYIRKEFVLLQIIPPRESLKSSYATEQLFAILHHMGSSDTMLEKIQGMKHLLSFEIVSTKEKGIRYLCRVEKSHAKTIENILLSYLPGVQIKKVDDYIKDIPHSKETDILTFHLKNHFAFPLKKQINLAESDPIAYITGAMTKLQAGEVISMQLVISPTKKKEAGILSHMILRSENVLEYLQKPHLPWFMQFVKGVLFGFVWLVAKIVKECGWAITEIVHGSQRTNHSPSSTYQDQVALHIRPARVLSAFEQEIVSSVQEKVSQPLFETSLRVCITLQNKQEKRERIAALHMALAQFSVSTYQSFVSTWDIFPISKLHHFSYSHRLLGNFLSRISILSVSEIAGLYHFPHVSTHTEDMVKNLSSELPTTTAQKNITPDVVFGQNTYGNTDIPIGLTDDERSRHVYILGQTGSGKSTIIFHMSKDDIQKGRGLAVIDPHGDLAEDLLSSIPEGRINDVVYINPVDISYPISINLLELTPGLSEDESELEKELVCESVISIFRRIFFNDESIDAHRIEYILRNTIYTAFYIKGATIFTIYTLLTNPDFHKEVQDKITDQNLLDFWQYEFSKAGNWQQVKMVSGVTAKIGRFLYSPIAKRMLENPTSSIDFDSLLSQNKIILCNLSEGELGEDTSRLLGTTIITKIHLAIQKRSRLRKASRTPFYLFVDEFQNFATSSFTKLLSGGRKFGLRIAIAQQSTAQQSDKRVTNIVLANTGTIICFRTASPVDEELMLSEFYPLVKKGDILNLPRFHFYIKLGSITPQEPFTGTTMPMQIPTDITLASGVVKASREIYAKRYVKPIPRPKRRKKLHSEERQNMEKVLV